MQLTRHFSLEELTCSEYAVRKGMVRWCHVAFASPGTTARRELLTIASAAQGYQSGLNPVA